MEQQKQRRVELATVEIRDEVNGGDPLILVNGADLSKCCVGYQVDRSNMGGPPVLTIRIACGKVNEERLVQIARPAAVAS